MLLEIENLKVSYGKSEALKGISMEVPEGQIVTILGANGAGKSTILRTISGLKAPASGEVRFQGNSIVGKPPEDIVKLGVSHAPEGRGLFPRMTVLDNLLMGAYLRRDRRQISEDLEHINELFPRLKERRGQMAGSMSGGEQQMIVIGRALMARPRLLLLDEPSLGLSPLVVQEIARVIKDINKDGVSILLVEQNARLALRYADSGYALETGIVKLYGSSRELLHNEMIMRTYMGR